MPRKDRFVQPGSGVVVVSSPALSDAEVEALEEKRQELLKKERQERT